MKTPRLPLLAALAVLLCTVPAFVRAGSAPAGKLYVSIDCTDPIHFKHLRLARAGGAELILSTLQSSAAEQARFAGYAGEVVVLDEKLHAPDGAPVLQLNWDVGTVKATLFQDGKEHFLGVVSRSPLSDHPNFQSMRVEIDRHQLRDERRDAELRAATQMNLYQALKYLVIFRTKSARP